jgi:hypothetical protein
LSPEVEPSNGPHSVAACCRGLVAPSPNDKLNCVIDKKPPPNTRIPCIVSPSVCQSPVRYNSTHAVGDDATPATSCGGGGGGNWRVRSAFGRCSRRGAPVLAPGRQRRPSSLMAAAIERVPLRKLIDFEIRSINMYDGTLYKSVSATGPACVCVCACARRVVDGSRGGLDGAPSDDQTECRAGVPRPIGGTAGTKPPVNPVAASCWWASNEIDAIGANKRRPARWTITNDADICRPRAVDRTTSRGTSHGGGGGGGGTGGGPFYRQKLINTVRASCLLSREFREPCLFKRGVSEHSVVLRLHDRCRRRQVLRSAPRTCRISSSVVFRNGGEICHESICS